MDEQRIAEIRGVARELDSWLPLTAADLTDLLAEVERLAASERAARAERDSIVRRIGRLQVDEGWWVGGVWGEYGEAVIPLRALSTLTGPLADQAPEWQTDPDFAATYGDLRATVDRLGADNDRLRSFNPCQGGEEQHSRHLEVCVPWYEHRDGGSDA